MSEWDNMGHYGRQREQASRIGRQAPVTGLCADSRIYRPLSLTNRLNGRAPTAAADRSGRRRCKAQMSKNASRPVSRVLYGPCLAAGTWRPFILSACRHAPHATYPGDWAGNSPEGCPSRHPYSVLLPVGFTLPRPLPSARWALTPPFHPCRENRGGLLSVALSLGSPPPAISRHRVSMEPGLSSPAAFRLRGCGRPASWQSV